MRSPLAAPARARLGASSRSGTRIKICGCAALEDVERALEVGADAVGFIFARSPRQITPQQAADLAQAVPDGITLVGVFVDPSRRALEATLAALPRMTLQFSGGESPDICRWSGRPYLKVLRVAATGGHAELGRQLERYWDALPVFETAGARAGGSGRPFPWDRVTDLTREREVVISGGLNPDNVADCVGLLRPYAVDVRSGVESAGRKDPARLRAFFAAVRAADAAT